MLKVAKARYVAVFAFEPIVFTQQRWRKKSILG